jgi:(4S)-4-hydroxy-5-phosphonooxypentane-2,3-dione isomerase
MIVIIGKVSIQPDKLEIFLGEVNKAIEATLKEAGVSRYELVQSVGKPNTFLLIEEYADEAALASHSESEHLKRMGAMLGAMLAGPPEVKKYNVTSTEML